MPGWDQTAWESARDERRERSMASTAIFIPLMRSWRIAELVKNIAETTQDYHIYVIATGECADTAKPLATGQSPLSMTAVVLGHRA